jgi:hypothetical protein
MESYQQSWSTLNTRHQKNTLGILTLLTHLK